MVLGNKVSVLGVWYLMKIQFHYEPYLWNLMQFGLYWKGLLGYIFLKKRNPKSAYISPTLYWLIIVIFFNMYAFLTPTPAPQLPSPEFS